MKVFIILFTSFYISACSSISRPTLYPNDVLKERGPIKANADIDECLKEADTYFNTPEGKKIEKANDSQTSYSGSLGFGSGFGNGFGSEVGIGVGVGPSERRYDVKRGFINQCLVNKGYQILSWE